MRSVAQSNITTMAILLLGSVALSACSGPEEDVRVTLCKDLATALLQSPEEPLWLGSETAIRRPEFAAIKVRFEAPNEQGTITPMQATCFYVYDVVEETAVDHIDPLSAYATLPYQVNLNGKPVAEPILTEVLKAQQFKPVEDLFDRIKQWFDDAVQYVKHRTL